MNKTRATLDQRGGVSSGKACLDLKRVKEGKLEGEMTSKHTGGGGMRHRAGRRKEKKQEGVPIAKTCSVNPEKR